MRRGCVQVEEQAMEGNGPKWRPIVRQGCKGGTALCRSEEGDPWGGSDLTIVFQGGCLISLSLCVFPPNCCMLICISALPDNSVQICLKYSEFDG